MKAFGCSATGGLSHSSARRRARRRRRAAGSGGAASADRHLGEPRAGPARGREPPGRRRELRHAHLHLRPRLRPGNIDRSYCEQDKPRAAAAVREGGCRVFATRGRCHARGGLPRLRDSRSLRTRERRSLQGGQGGPSQLTPLLNLAWHPSGLTARPAFLAAAGSEPAVRVRQHRPGRRRLEPPGKE